MNALDIFPRWFLPIVIAISIAVHCFVPDIHKGGSGLSLAWINFVVQIVIMIVAAVVSYAMTPKPKPPKPASITDFDLPTAEEGREIPVIFGDVWITGPNVLWFGDLRSAPIKSKAGKK